ncbi:hypothetical protein KIH87_05780 [Paraneptunicella aestuarii]|uniref:hypothetical protein n=1 Tax=Paraneptunicella aestuarii TaxID=2831148 RepID=UPI001E5E891E|nr:hypothetical protein [Paraneptunicella aestuarii]UAA39863.1 hypothetical protein KIH87_05780 [Paraneptunicella aestuarii]
MMKHRIANFMLTLLGLVTVQAQSETYNVDVEVASSVGQNLLTLAETRPTSYPIIAVNDATPNDARCGANNKPNDIAFDGNPVNNVNSLCPQLTGETSIIQFTGVPNATINITYSAPIQDKAGIRFSLAHTNLTTLTSFTYSTAFPSTEGILYRNIFSKVELYDKSLVIDGVLDFTYEVTAAYQ